MTRSDPFRPVLMRSLRTGHPLLPNGPKACHPRHGDPFSPFRGERVSERVTRGRKAGSQNGTIAFTASVIA